MDTAVQHAPLSRTCSMPRATPITKPVVFVIDDDISVRESLEGLIAEAGWRPEAYATAQEFLARPRQALPSCLVLDVRLPDLNGLELQRRISNRADLPIIFITGHGDIPMSVRAMKAGAVEFLPKPFNPDEMLGAIKSAIERSRTALAERSDLLVLQTRYSALSRRERQVLELVVRGQLNKQVGGELGISEITVKAHRGRMMRKMRATSLPDLVNIAARLRQATTGANQNP
jgi:FixJ family two-component response regulator